MGGGAAVNQEIYEMLIEKLAELRRQIDGNEKAKNCVSGIESFILGARLGTAAMEKGGEL